MLASSLKIRAATEREILITRLFDAPPERVFDAFTQPDLIRRWLGVFGDWGFEVCEVDLRPGGAYRWVWRNAADGSTLAVSGILREVRRPERLVMTEVAHGDRPGAGLCDVGCRTGGAPIMTARKRAAVAPPRAVGKAQVDVFLAGIEHPLMAEIQALRRIILKADPAISQAVKWNAPSFYTTDHFATLKLHPPTAVQVVFHTGATARRLHLQTRIDDSDRLLKWLSPERAVVTFDDLKSILGHRAALTRIVRDWTACLNQGQA